MAHGLYSWVPESVQEAILALAADHLKPSGIAYISYNAQPGWAIRGLVRDMLLRNNNIKRLGGGEAKALEAIKLASHLLEDLPSRQYAFGALLAEELERVRDGYPFYVFHEYLAKHNQGFWLSEFVEKARSHGLEYVGDAQSCRWEGYASAELKQTLQHRGFDSIQYEETIDFLCNRFFTHPYYGGVMLLCGG